MAKETEEDTIEVGIDDLKRKLASAEETIAAYSDDYDMLERHIDSGLAKIKALENEAVGLSANALQAESESRIYVAEIGSLRECIGQLKTVRDHYKAIAIINSIVLILCAMAIAYLLVK